MSASGSHLCYSTTFCAVELFCCRRYFTRSIFVKHFLYLKELLRSFEQGIVNHCGSTLKYILLAVFFEAHLLASAVSVSHEIFRHIRLLCLKFFHPMCWTQKEMWQCALPEEYAGHFQFLWPRIISNLDSILECTALCAKLRIPNVAEVKSCLQFVYHVLLFCAYQSSHFLLNTPVGPFNWNIPRVLLCWKATVF